MSRLSRNNINSRYIHVITQGINKEYIFQKNQYKKEYLNLLNKKINETTYTKLLAYCIMDNHAHLLIYAEDVNELSKIMSKVDTSYGIFYNKNENRVGYVFRNRYYSQQILDEKHLYNTMVYIHKNPLKAKIVKKENQYKYSSYNSYVKNNVDENIIKLIFKEDDYMKQFYYIHKNFSEENIIEIKEEKEEALIKMKNVVIEFCKEYNIDLNSIRKNNYLLLMLIKKIKKESDATNKAISEYIGIGKNRITKLFKNIENNKK